MVDAGGAVPAAGEDPVAARTEAPARQGLGVTAEIEQKLARARVPEAGGELARRHDPMAVGTEAAGVDCEEVADEDPPQASAGRVPDASGVVGADRDQLAAVRRILRIVDALRMPFERVEEPAGRGVPELSDVALGRRHPETARREDGVLPLRAARPEHACRPRPRQPIPDGDTDSYLQSLQAPRRQAGARRVRPRRPRYEADEAPAGRRAS